MRRLFVAFAILAAFMVAPNLATAQLSTEQQASLTSTLTGAGTTQAKAQAVTDLLARANFTTVLAIADILVANGSAEVIATVINAEYQYGGGIHSSAFESIAYYLGRSSDIGKVESVLGLLYSERTVSAQAVKRQAWNAGNFAVLNIPIVSAANGYGLICLRFHAAAASGRKSEPSCRQPKLS